MKQYIESKDTHQYLELSSCHLYHSKKSVPYNQAHRSKRICSEDTFFDNRCNQLECLLKDRGYNEKVVRKQILKAREFTRKDLVKFNESQYIVLFVVSGSIKKLFSIDCLNIYHFSIFFSIDFAQWKCVALPHIAYIGID